jgi:hypothetical protein
MRLVAIIPAAALALTLAAWVVAARAGGDDTGFPTSASALNPKAETDADADAAQRRAEAATMDLSRSLRDALMSKMASEGPVASIEFCHVNAPLIAEAVAQRHGVSVGRVGVRVRNPDNAATTWRDAMLKTFVAQAAAGQPADQLTHVQVDPTDRVLRYARGIRTDAVCLACHGPAVSPQVTKAINARYPQDAASGFSEGQLRGAIWAEVSLTQPQASVSDTRVAVPLTVARAARLRADMRAQLEGVQGIVAALAAGDWTAVAELAEARAGQGGASAAAAPGSDFRQQLPPAWRNLGRPMHADFALLADEARGEQRMAMALDHLGRATERCTACHASFRIVEGDDE